MNAVWLIKLILAHLLTDFILQPKKWVDNKNERHALSASLYVDALVAGTCSLLLIGIHYWVYALMISITHFFIDLWKSYRPRTSIYFLVDQFLHLLVILVCWYFAFFSIAELQRLAQNLHSNHKFWILLCGYIFITFPVGILIGQLTKKWSDKLPNNKGLADAGKWIGILERIIILTFLLLHQYAAIGLLITAKGLLRFNDKESQEEKTEYVLIGSLLSICISLLTGMLVNHLLAS